MPALRAGGGGFARHGAGPATLPMQGLRQDLQRADRHAAIGPAPQGALAVRGLACGRRDGEGVGGALRCGGEHGVPLASSLSGGGAGWFGGAQGHRGGGRDVRWRAGRARASRKARRRGGKAKKRGLSREQVPVLMAVDRGGTTFSAVLPRVDAMVLTAALDPVVARDALLVSDGGASYPPCAAALGVSHESLNRSMGERVRGDLQDGEPATAAGRTSCDRAGASPPAIWTTI